MDYSKQMLVCAKCKFVSYCSRECQVKDWKDHKADCSKFQDEEYKIERKITRKFLAKHRHLLIEKLKSVSLETGLEIIELSIDLDFRALGHAIAPALRNPPEFDIVPLKCFCKHSEGKKAFTESMVSKLGNNFVCLCLSFEHTERGGFGAVQLESDTFGEIWFLQNLFVEEMID